MVLCISSITMPIIINASYNSMSHRGSTVILLFGQRATSILSAFLRKKHSWKT